MTEKLSTEFDFSYLDRNYAEIKERIAAAAAASGRQPEEIKLMAVTKTVAPPPINHMIALGVDLIGENKVQELLSKTDFLNTDGLQMHIIGHLQSNKVRKIIGIVSMIESVDSVELAREISKRSILAGTTTDILLEVNIGREEAKTGFDYDEALERASEISELENVRIRGFMAVPPICEGDEVRKYFAKMNTLYMDTKSKLGNGSLIDTLSLGMSADFEDAIKEGSTLVRVGSALFGARRY